MAHHVKASEMKRDLSWLVTAKGQHARSSRVIAAFMRNHHAQEFVAVMEELRHDVNYQVEVSA